MSSPNDAAPPRLLVEHRLRLALSTIDLLQHLARVADEPRFSLFDDVPSFARVVWSFARTTEVHLRAANAAVSPQASVDPPIAAGGER